VHVELEGKEKKPVNDESKGNAVMEALKGIAKQPIAGVTGTQKIGFEVPLIETPSGSGISVTPYMQKISGQRGTVFNYDKSADGKTTGRSVNLLFFSAGFKTDISVNGGVDFSGGGNESVKLNASLGAGDLFQGKGTGILKVSLDASNAGKTGIGGGAKLSFQISAVDLVMPAVGALQNTFGIIKSLF